MPPVGRIPEENVQQQGRGQQQEARNHGSAFQLQEAVDSVHIQMFPDDVRQTVKSAVNIMGYVQGRFGRQAGIHPDPVDECPPEFVAVQKAVQVRGPDAALSVTAWRTVFPEHEGFARGFMAGDAVVDFIAGGVRGQRRSGAAYIEQGLDGGESSGQFQQPGVRSSADS